MFFVINATPSVNGARHVRGNNSVSLLVLMGDMETVWRLRKASELRGFQKHYVKLKNYHNPSYFRDPNEECLSFQCT